MKTLAPSALVGIPGLVRCEEFDRNALGERITELTHTVYGHDQVYGRYCTIHRHIACPPDELFAYMRDPYSLMEWTYSVRELKPVDGGDLLVGVDAERTPIYVKTVANEHALTVDYHCAWDQGDELWMVYLYRIVPAELVLKQPGSVVIWTNCRHPYYDENPFPELNRDPLRTWVGDWWPLFYGGHSVELDNLQAIVEHRHRLRLPLGPPVQEAP
ncbi:MAG TPA: hypothetical protein VGK73_15245 [Polyangiaceae bacterium]